MKMSNVQMQCVCPLVSLIKLEWVAPSIGKKFEQLKLPSKDQVNEFFEIEAVNFQKTEIQNKELSSKNTVLIYLNFYNKKWIMRRIIHCNQNVLISTQNKNNYCKIFINRFNNYKTKLISCFILELGITE
jgi:hypothetical protein